MGTYLIRTGRLQGRTFAIREGDVVSLGRRNADLVLPDMMVSRKHCLLDVVEGVDEVTDMVSVNGTWLDGERVERAKLTTGNVIRLGETEIEYLGTQVDGPHPGTLAGVVPATGVPGGDYNTVDVNIEDVKEAMAAEANAKADTRVQEQADGEKQPADAAADTRPDTPAEASDDAADDAADNAANETRPDTPADAAAEAPPEAPADA
jgi:pSer/pThr/pTyr-binding forkhead associated (FHA) protein